ncbi:hypothetical protein M3Y97_00849300 [Aphelenchoides bicaudatus]|nr:hypothetical protein M3Y97_00849300 [Aphelenchoides bicaudatus]
MSGHQQQPNQSISHQQMSMQNVRMSGNQRFPVYSMPRQVPMHPNMSQQHRMAQQPRYVIARPPPNGQNPQNSQQMHAGSPQLYQQSPNQNPQMMHGMNRGQPRAIQPNSQQIQIMQQSQGTPPNQQQNYNTSSPYTPPTPQQQYSNQHHYSQPSTPQDRQIHQRIQQQGMQRPMTPQQQHSQSPIPRKNTVTMVRTNSLQSSDGSQQSDQQPHYIVQTSVPTSVYNVVQGSSSQPQIMHHVNINDSQQQDNNYGQPTRPGSMQIRHPVTQRPVHFANQSNAPTVRYNFSSGQQIPQGQQIVVQQSRNMIRGNAPGEYRQQQYIQLVRPESDFSGATTTYRTPVSSNDQNYVVASQPNVLYRTAIPQQPNSAIRHALENNFQPQIQTSQAPVIIQSLDGSNGQLVFKVPTSMPRQTSSDSYDSNNYAQSSMPSVVEANVSEYAVEHQLQRPNIDDDTPSDLSGSHDESSPIKKAKFTPKSGKSANSSASKPKSKTKKAPIKTIANKTISTFGQEYGNEDAANGHNSNAKPVITKEILERTAKAVSQSLTLEDEAKAGIILHMESFVNKLVQETGRATNLRKSKVIQNKDVEYALKTKFNINSISQEKMDQIAAKFAK